MFFKTQTVNTLLTVYTPQHVGRRLPRVKELL